MTTPAPGGRPSLLRVGGLALVGIAVVAAIIGLVSVAGDGGNGTPAAAPADTTPTDAPPSEPAPPPAPLSGEQAPPDDSAVPVPPLEESAPAEQPGGAPPAGEPNAVPPAEQQAPAPAPQGNPPPPDPSDGSAASPPAPAPAPNGGGDSARAGEAPGGAAGKGGTSLRAPLRVYNNSTISGLASRAAEEFRQQGWTIDEVGNYPDGIIPASTVYFRPGTDEEASARALAEAFGMRAHPRFEGLKDASPGIIVIITQDYAR